jgi:hypothetical protein
MVAKDSITNHSESVESLNTSSDIIVSIGGIRNFVLNCLFHNNEEICERFKFSILDFFMITTDNTLDVGKSVKPNIIIDLSLIQMFKEFRAKRNFLKRE